MNLKIDIIEMPLLLLQKPKTIFTVHFFRELPNWKDISLSNSVKGKTGRPCKSKEIALTTCTRSKDLITVCYIIFEIARCILKSNIPSCMGSY
jgi:hypothetical protein